MMSATCDGYPLEFSRGEATWILSEMALNSQPYGTPVTLSLDRPTLARNATGRKGGHGYVASDDYRVRRIWRMPCPAGGGTHHGLPLDRE